MKSKMQKYVIQEFDYRQKLLALADAERKALPLKSKPLKTFYI